ncbi:MAG: hypothetical protein WCK01_04730 [Candidatus Uhrbacteria bacterium]
MDDIRSERIRALALWDAMSYPPTEAELGAVAGFLPVEAPLTVTRGRLTFVGREELVKEHELREALFPRKIRAARKAAKWLARLSGVRFVALCNTTALMHARDGGDLDFFVITRSGVLTQTRGWAALRFALTGRRPSAQDAERDAVCLSFFVDDSHLDISPLMLSGDDPYFRLWFLSLLPLVDDGVSAEFWKVNARIREQHPYARPWIMHPSIHVKIPWMQIPSFKSLDPLAAAVQARTMSQVLREKMNKDTRVVITPHVHKFHADDGRERFREQAAQTCKQYGVAP